MVLMMLVPTFAFAEEMDMKAIEDQIKETIDYSDREIYGHNFNTRAVEDFAVYHREENKLSMADDAFDKDKSTVKENGTSYTFTFYLKPVKKMGCWADCTEIKFMDKDGQNEVTDPSKITIEKLVVNGETEKKAANSDKKVPYGFVITISKEYLNDLSGKEKSTTNFHIILKLNLKQI